MYFGMSDILLLAPALILTLYAQFKIKSAYNKWSQVSSTSGLTGAQVAKSLLQRNSILDVEVGRVEGNLTDHYDPIHKTLNLSDGVYATNSIAAIGVAAHETGHAIQHNVAYSPLKLRQTMYPLANFGSMLAMPLFIIGLMVSSLKFLTTLGIAFFAASVFFTLVTLPVEFNASKRALAQLTSSGMIKGEEVDGARKVLNAAALTYVAAAAMAVLQLIRLLMIRNDH
ncbi:MAG: putative neutral zinc metallopeptidase [bacterium ADurb.Bin431]|nr:MAG: putative neutral zinc metallopeptidase [bacterium ADurb.Bin431]HNY91541.1 zinc metallopeptidase [bacterium]HOC24852.1 zinc metallopeptidase [bacterium]HOH08915.1 zinc metallopeptidase [bacterium]HOY45658.1 zinc metallopeptidase [bacterium]